MSRGSGIRCGGGTRAYLRSGPGVTAPALSDGAATYTPGVSEVRGGVSTFVTGGLKNQDAHDVRTRLTPWDD